MKQQTKTKLYGAAFAFSLMLMPLAAAHAYPPGPGFVPGPGFAAGPRPGPGRHPGYFHALNDLRTARWMLEQTPGGRFGGREAGMAMQEIDGALADAQRSGIFDGRNVHEHAGAVVPPDYFGRLQAASDILSQAQADLARDEGDPETRFARHRIRDHIDAALHDIRHAQFRHHR